MTYGFADPISGQNGSLIRPWLQSPNFVHNVSGWRIAKDGSVEFNNAIFRGSVTILNNQVILIYSSAAPALGTLVMSIAPVAGVDSVGNAYSSGFDIYGTLGRQLSIQLASGNPFMFFNSGASGENLGAKIQTLLNGGGGSAQYGQLVVSSDVNTTNKDSVALLLGGSSTDGTQAAEWDSSYVDLSNVIHTYMRMSYFGMSLTGRLTSVDPATGLTTSNVAAPETWHNAAFAAGFANTGSVVGTCQYQKESINGGRTRLKGEFKLTAAQVANAIVFTLPPAYTPINQQEIYGANSLTGAVASRGAVYVDNLGNVRLAVAGGINNVAQIHGVIELD